MVRTASAFFKLSNPDLAFIFSDEISLLYTKTPIFRRVEKIDSVFAGIASSVFTKLAKRYAYREPIAFDCRVIPLTKKQVVKYLIWRQAEAFRNSNNAWAQWVLVRKGMSARAAAKRLAGLKSSELCRLTLAEGVNLAKTPAWQRRGILIHRTRYMKKGYDPVRRKAVLVWRRKVVEDWEPPRFDTRAGKKFLGKCLAF